jgi:signal peptidase I
MDDNQIAKATESPEDISDKAKKRKAGWLVRDVFEWGETLVSAVIIIVVVFTFVMRVTSVDGGSMMPTLHNKDQMLVTNLFYTPKLGDIVVIYAPNLYCEDKRAMGKDIIKRIIGLEGDTIRIGTHIDGDGRVYRNGEPLSLPGELEEDGYFINSPTYVHGVEPLEITIPEGKVFVLGDNRGSSVDSRYIDMVNRQGTVGLVDVNHVAGKAFFRVIGDSDEYGGFWGAFGFVR